MCQSPNHGETCDNCRSRIGGRRSKLWEIDRSFHCSIIGTCLTQGDLHSLTRRLGVRFATAHPSEYEIHVSFVRAAREKGSVAVFMHKLLERKHALTISRFSRARSREELEDLWREAFKSGDVAGGYWALLSHPGTDSEMAGRAFGDVHMLSHLLGAANRADISTLRRLEEENSSLRHRMENERADLVRRLSERDREMESLRASLEEARLRLFGEEASEEESLRRRKREAREGGMEMIAEKLRQRLAAQEARNTEQESRLDRLTERLVATQADHRELESAFADLLAENRELRQRDNPDQCPAGAPCPLDLGGRCILYVGGRPHQAGHLRDLVERWNGSFLYHDGGLENGVEQLNGILARADTVLFPADCVSHNASNRIKRLCQRNGKPFVPLRSTGMGAFVQALRHTSVSS